MELAPQRRVGLILGLALGLGYSLSSNLINIIVLPNIPFYVPPPGTFGLIVLTSLLFGALGLISAWTEESLPGVLLSALVGSVISSIWILLNETSSRAATFIVLFLVFLPRIFFYLPFSGGVRWLVSKLEQPYRRDVPPVRRLFPVLIAFLIAIFAGTFVLYSKEVRRSLVKMDELIQLGSQASTRDELPKPLQSVQGFIANAKGKYTLDIGSDPDVLPVQRPIVEFGEIEPFIIIKFDNGFRFGCVFSPPYVVPACIDF